MFSFVEVDKHRIRSTSTKQSDDEIISQGSNLCRWWNGRKERPRQHGATLPRHQKMVSTQSLLNVTNTVAMIIMVIIDDRTLLPSGPPSLSGWLTATMLDTPIRSHHHHHCHWKHFILWLFHILFPQASPATVNARLKRKTISANSSTFNFTYSWRHSSITRKTCRISVHTVCMTFGPNKTDEAKNRSFIHVVKCTYSESKLAVSHVYIKSSLWVAGH